MLGIWGYLFWTTSLTSTAIAARTGFSKSNNIKETAEEENKRLRAENKLLKQERDILKKATAYFAKGTL